MAYVTKIGGGGNRTPVRVYVTVFPKCSYDTTLGAWPEMGREAQTS
jgi:hypothetical protein